MTYGQTSSGKTFTLFGDEKDPSKPGFIKQYLELLYDNQKEINAYDDYEWNINYSFFEIYNEKILDMLNESDRKLNLRESPNIYIEGLECKKAVSLQEILQDLNNSFQRRHTSQTIMNQQSSRSHFIINFEVESIQYMDLEEQKQKSVTDSKKKNYYEVVKKSKIIFIDLAGSEKQSENQNQIMEEGCYINKSLSNLNRIIQALSKKDKKEGNFQHFWDSKLTHYLKEIFLGNSHFSIIGHVLPYQIYLQETLNTLNFVSLAKQISTNPKINFVTKDNSFAIQKQIKFLMEQIDLLKQENSKGGINQESLTKIQQKQKSIIDILHHQEKFGSNLESLIQKINTQIKTIQSELDKSQTISLKPLNDLYGQLKSSLMIFIDAKNSQLSHSLKISLDQLNINIENIRSQKQSNLATPTKERKSDVKYSTFCELKKSFINEEYKPEIWNQENINLYNNNKIDSNTEQSLQDLKIKLRDQQQEFESILLAKEEQNKTLFYQLEKQKNKFDKKHNILHNWLVLLEKQIWNRNKDYLYALKELEKNKISPPPTNNDDYDINIPQYNQSNVKKENN